MALPRTNSAEGGSNGVTVTTGNSGGASGDAFTDITIGSDGTLVYDTSRAAHGGLSIKYTRGAVPSGDIRFGWAESVTEIYGRCYIYRTAFPTSVGQMLINSQLSGTGVCGFVDMNTSGQLRVWDSVSSVVGFTNAITLNAWNRVEFRVLCNAGAGIVTAKLFLGDSTGLIEQQTLSSAQTRASMTHTFFGEMWQQDPNGVCWFDDLQINATDFPGPALEVTATGFQRRGLSVVS